MSIGSRILLTLLAALPAAVPAAEAAIDFVFLGHADYERYSSYAWRGGIRAKDPAMERRIRAAVNSALARKGWRLTEGEADLYLRTEVVSLTSVSVGALRLEVLDGPSGQPALRAMATTVVAAKREKLPKLIDKTVKKLLRQFPEAGGR